MVRSVKNNSKLPRVSGHRSAEEFLQPRNTPPPAQEPQAGPGAGRTGGANRRPRGSHADFEEKMACGPDTVLRRPAPGRRGRAHQGTDGGAPVREPAMSATRPANRIRSPRIRGPRPRTAGPPAGRRHRTRGPPARKRDTRIRDNTQIRDNTRIRDTRIRDTRIPRKCPAPRPPWRRELRP